MDLVCRDAETLGVKWRNHYVKEEDAKKRFYEILETSMRMNYKIDKRTKNEMLINEQDYITLEK